MSQKAKDNKINFDRLKEPFLPEDIEWRIQRIGRTTDGKIWAQVLAYVTNRAVMERLDEVCGADRWKNEYREAPDGGILCGISIKLDDDTWITKWDGADKTSIEAVKGGLSNAMKRASVQWGIGRYLYQLEENFVDVTTQRPQSTEGYQSAYSKDFGRIYYKTPKLPEWALPRSKKKSSAKANSKEDLLNKIHDKVITYPNVYQRVFYRKFDNLKERSVKDLTKIYQKLKSREEEMSTAQEKIKFGQA